jgi:hypothetical protein
VGERVADGDGEGIRLVRSHRSRQREQHPHHALDLRLLRLAVAADGSLDRGRRVGPDREPAAAGSLAARAREHYDRAIRAQREGDWALYGEEIGKLGKVIGEMR